MTCDPVAVPACVSVVVASALVVIFAVRAVREWRAWRGLGGPF